MKSSPHSHLRSIFAKVMVNIHNESIVYDTEKGPRGNIPFLKSSRQWIFPNIEYDFFVNRWIIRRNFSS